MKFNSPLLCLIIVDALALTAQHSLTKEKKKVNRQKKTKGKKKVTTDELHFAKSDEHAQTQELLPWLWLMELCPCLVHTRSLTLK